MTAMAQNPKHRPKLGITDHALVRWLERTRAMPIEMLREVLAQSLERALHAAEAIGQGEFLILADGMVFVVRDGAVITVLDEDKRHAHIHNALKRHRLAREAALESGQA
jgi:hypothetical protein